MIISAILILLGVPLWMLLGMLILIFWNSRRVKKQKNTFPVKVLIEKKSNKDEEIKWPRKVSYAQWVHDVLILRKGPGLMLTVPYGIKDVEGSAQTANPKHLKGLGKHPKIVRAVLDDGSILLVAVQKIRPELAPKYFLAKVK